MSTHPPPALSIVMCSRDDAKFASISKVYEAVLRGVPFELIRIPDARSICEGYNRGIRKAQGDLLLFSHDDLEILTDRFADRLLRHMERFDMLGIVGTSRLIGPFWTFAGPPYLYGQMVMDTPDGLQACVLGAPARSVGNIQALDGVLICSRRSVAERLLFDEEIPGFDGYDTDFSYRAFRAGFKVGVACDLDILHRGRTDTDSPDWRAAALVVLRKHRATLPPEPAALRVYKMTTVKARSRDEALEVLRPPHWDWKSD